MEINPVFSAMLFSAIGGFILGASCGILYESSPRGFSGKEINRLQKILLRMIPKLKEHYTSSYIYHELIKDQPDER